MVSCGSRHTVCLTEHGYVYAFGWNGFGQLGTPMSIKASDVPLLLKLPDESYVGSVESVHCGLWSTVVVVKKQ
ncbi:RCC1 domain-containing protein 1 [Fasciola gigantica]|uniref:RCC1 domain-containing protein 1 n=1 Tax=Fasciola gigantica TaxID=46835 RepID=A0A504YW03_FASGI|nr:RCC1 domain-containing protein 1 [Fasciola gigantica]